MASGTALSWPIVGRDEELAFIERARAARAGRYVVVATWGVSEIE
jgi:hypothetical protein